MQSIRRTKNQKGEKCNAINQKDQKGKKCNQSDESIEGEMQSIRRIKRGEETKLWALDSPNNQIEESKGEKKPNCEHTLTKQPKCENSTHQTSKLWVLDPPNKQTNFEHYFDSPNN